jgi:Flp pilus assembly protein TadG
VTRRILAGFIAVLLAVLAAIVVPLGIVVTGQQRRDFRDAARGAARAVAALAEER